MLKPPFTLQDGDLLGVFDREALKTRHNVATSPLYQTELDTRLKSVLVQHKQEQ